jgi:cardiolipin synthase
MAVPIRSPASLKRRAAVVRACALAAIAFIVGCQVSGGRFRAVNSDQSFRRCALVVGQVAEDTAVELVHRPADCLRDMIVVPATDLCAIGRGAVAKRIVLPLQSHAPLQACACRLVGYGPDGDDGSAPLKPARINLYIDGGPALGALEQLFDQATCRIDVLMYQWEDDTIGAAIAQRLAARAGPHVRVRVLVDGGGNLVFGCPGKKQRRSINDVLCDLARQPYVQVIRTRNPFARFDHRKLVLVDGKKAWTGGRNFTEACFEGIHDLSFTVEGPLVADLEECFERFWREQGGPPATGLMGPAVSAESGCGPLCENALARLIRTEPITPEIEHALYAAIDRAQHHVYLENFTFSDSLLVYKLAQARRRGADVRAVLTLSCCCRTVNSANRVTANRLLRAGVRVYVDPQMTHVKAAVVDGCWAYLGTANFDPLSLRHNRELGLAIAAGPILGELEERLFAQDLQPDWELRAPLALSASDYAFELLSSLCL